MRAAVFTRPGLVELTDLPTPSAGRRDLVEGGGGHAVRHRPAHLRSGAKSAGVVPGTVMGHEIAGRIEQVGDGVDGYDVGAQATVSIVVACDHCPSAWPGSSTCATT